MDDERKKLNEMISQFRITELHSLLVCFGLNNITNKHPKRHLQCEAYKLLSRIILTNQFDIFSYVVLVLHSRISNSDNFIRHVMSTRNQLLNSSNATMMPLRDVHGERSLSDQLRNIDIDRLRQTVFFEPLLYEKVADICSVVPLVPKNERFQQSIPRVYFYENRFLIDHHLLLDKNNRIVIRIGILNRNMSVIYDCLPLGVGVTVNNKWCSPSIRTSVPTRDSCSFKPIDITSCIDNRFTRQNLVVTWLSKSNNLYGYALQVIRRKSYQKLVECLKAKGEQNALISKEIIRRSLEDNSDEIVATSLKTSLVCPLGKILMSLPTRATTCNHLQCFDGHFFIKMNAVLDTWLCPICNQPCLFENLNVDGYFMDILRSERFRSDMTEVLIRVDGLWYYSSENSVKRSKNSEHEIASKKIKIEEDDCGEESPSAAQKPLTSSKEVNPNVSYENDNNVSNMNFSSMSAVNYSSAMNEIETPNSDTEDRTSMSPLYEFLKESKDDRSSSPSSSKESKESGELSPSSDTSTVADTLSENAIPLVDITDSASDIDDDGMNNYKKHENYDYEIPCIKIKIGEVDRVEESPRVAWPKPLVSDKTVRLTTNVSDGNDNCASNTNFPILSSLGYSFEISKTSTANTEGSLLSLNPSFKEVIDLSSNYSPEEAEPIYVTDSD